MPLVGLILLASVLGLPLGAVVLLALGFLYTLGYVASAYFLGRLIRRPPSFAWVLTPFRRLSIARLVRDAIAPLPSEERGPTFFAIWTLKEAFVKGIGRGISFPLDAFCFDLDGARLVRFRPLADFVSRD